MVTKLFVGTVPTNNFFILNMFKADMEIRLSTSMSSLYRQYVNLTNYIYNPSIYEERIIITKWRLSNHRLKIETGRYHVPKIPPNERYCLTCYPFIENEQHVLFECPLYEEVRHKYNSLFVKYPLVNAILNPNCASDAETLGRFLLEIESIRTNVGLDNDYYNTITVVIGLEYSSLE